VHEKQRNMFIQSVASPHPLSTVDIDVIHVTRSPSVLGFPSPVYLHIVSTWS